MPKERRSENKGLPARWTFQHGAYYFQVPKELIHLWDGKRFYRLGKNLSQAYIKWAERFPASDKANNISQLLDRYALEVSPTKSAATRTSDIRDIEKIRKAFGEMPIAAIQPQHVYKYMDKRSKKVTNEKGKSVGGATSARHEIALLSKVYTKAVMWGYIHKHPFKGEVILEGTPPRDRYVEDWEIVECLSLSCMRKKGSVKAIQAYIKIKLLTGMSKGDLLRLDPAKHFTSEGIQVTRRKTKRSTGKTTIYEWSDELLTATEEAKAARPVHIAPFLFCTKLGEGYFNEDTGVASGWDSMWARFMDRVLEETEVKVRFTEHDLRAKCASDADTLERARQMLAHADSKTTNRIYRRKPERVKPAK